MRTPLRSKNPPSALRAKAGAFARFLGSAASRRNARGRSPRALYGGGRPASSCGRWRFASPPALVRPPAEQKLALLLGFWDRPLRGETRAGEARALFTVVADRHRRAGGGPPRPRPH